MRIIRLGEVPDFMKEVETTCYRCSTVFACTEDDKVAEFGDEFSFIFKCPLCGEKVWLKEDMFDSENDKEWKQKTRSRKKVRREQNRNRSHS